MHRLPTLSWLGWACCALLSGVASGSCSSANPEDGWQAPNANDNLFRTEVYPVLLRDCAFHTCHGSEQRFFRVWGPGRVRLGGRSAFDCLPGDEKVMQPDGSSQCRSKDEVDASFDNAISFIDGKDPARSIILRKPLATEAGGMGHLGVDKFGRNLYRTTDSPGYLTLSRWVFSLHDQ